MMRQFSFTSLAATHQGLVRGENEDAHLARPDVGLWLVADGMGGLEHGRWASAAIVAEAQGLVLGGDFEADLTLVSDAIRTSNRTIQHAATEGGRMGSTVAALLIRGPRWACLWAGDSRIYRFRDGQLSRLTHDHTHVQDLVDRGRLSNAEAQIHPLAHILTHAVGIATPMRLDIVCGEVEAGDRFLLCSDGLTAVVDESEIADQLAGADLYAACDQLLKLALDRGGPDNITMVAVACGAQADASLPGDA